MRVYNNHLKIDLTYRKQLIDATNKCTRGIKKVIFKNFSQTSFERKFLLMAGYFINVSFVHITIDIIVINYNI